MSTQRKGNKDRIVTNSAYAKVKLDQLPPITPGEDPSYESDILQRWGLEKPSTSSSPPPSTSGAEKVPTFTDKLNNFRSAFIKLKLESPPPHTTKSVVTSHRCELLALTRHHQIISDETIELLDTNWEILGENTIVQFFNLMTLRNPDNRIIQRSGPFAFLSGAICYSQMSSAIKVEELMSQLSMVTADLNLFDLAMKSNREAVDQAETVWRSQTDTIAAYMSKLEGLLKQNVDSAERAKLRPQKHSLPAHQEDNETDVITFGNFQYKNINGTWCVRTINPATSDEMKIQNQTEKFLKSKSYVSKIITMDPVDLIQKYWIIKKKNSDPKTAFKSLMEEGS